MGRRGMGDGLTKHVRNVDNMFTVGTLTIIARIAARKWTVMEMVNRENVINGLECCKDIHTAGPGYAQGCILCPYGETPSDGAGGYACFRAMVKDTLALLKAQEPRVMTQEELAAAQKTPVWRETKNKHKDLYNGWMLTYEIQRGLGITGLRQGMTEPNGRVGWGCKLDDYGKTWRCWTSRPTDEQREAVEWDA